MFQIISVKVRFFVIFTTFLFFSQNIIKSSDCPKDQPIEITNNDQTSCSLTYCTDEQFTQSVCKIANPITKIQWLNKNIIFGYSDVYVIDEIDGANNELIFISNKYSTGNRTVNTNRFFYFLNPKDQKPFENAVKKEINSTNYERNFAASLILIKIDGTEYLINCHQRICEIIDYLKGNSYLIVVEKMGNLTIVINCESYFLFKQNNATDDNKIIIGYSFDLGSNSYISFKELSFTYDINDGIKAEIVKENDYTKLNVLYGDFLRLICFSTDQNLIECMYINSNSQYYIAVLNIEFELIINDYLDNASDFGCNYCTHLQKEIGACVYFPVEVKSPKLIIKNIIKNNDQYELVNLINDEIRISITNDIDILYTSFLSENFRLLKINENKFIYSIYDDITNIIYIVVCNLYGSNLNNINLRYYTIYLDLYSFGFNRYLLLFKYEEYLGMGFASLENTNNNPNYAPLFIFGIYSDYEEKTINLGIIETNYSLILNNYFNSTIDNNLFGYEFVGFIVNSIPNISYGIKFYSKNNNNTEISNNDLLNLNDEIIIDNTNINAKISTIFSFEIAPELIEPEYNNLYLYSDKNVSYGNENYENYYKRGTFIGKIIRFNFTYECNQNCDSCEYIGPTSEKQLCSSCKNNFCYLTEEKNCYNISALIYNYYKNQEKNYLCVPLDGYCPDEYPFVDSKTFECVEKLDYKSLLDKDYVVSNDPSELNKTNQLIAELIKSGSINPNEDFTRTGTNITIQVTTTEKQSSSTMTKDKISTIDLGECENILKNYYNISRSLIIYKIDIRRNDSYAAQVEYEVINPNNYEILDLSICNGTKIDLYSPIYLEDEEYELYKYLENQGYNLFDSEDSFYTDICTPFDSENETDVLLKDRKNDYYKNNITLCETGCTYDKINTEVDKVHCECEVKTSINVDTSQTDFSINTLANNFYKISDYSNIMIIKCYKTTFSKIGQTKNYGSYIVLCMWFLFICAMIAHHITAKAKTQAIFDLIIKEMKDLNQPNKAVISLNSYIEKNDKLNDNENEAREIMMRSCKKKNTTRSKISKKAIRKNLKKNKNFNNLEIDSIAKINANTLKFNSEDKEAESNPPKRISCCFRAPIIINGESEDKKNDKGFSSPKISQRERHSIKNLNKENNVVVFRSMDEENEKNKTTKKKRIKKKSLKEKLKEKKELREDEKNDEGELKTKKIKKRKSKLKLTKSVVNEINPLDTKTKVSSIKKTEHKEKDSEIKLKKSETKKEKIREDGDRLSIKRMKKIIKEVPKPERYKHFNELELNAMQYEYACEIDTRSFIRYYWSLIKKKHIIVSTFIDNEDYNIFLLKLGLFLVSFNLYFCVNCLFFTDDTMHKLYKDKGKYSLLFQIPQIIYSTLISSVTLMLLKQLSLSQKEIISLKKKSQVKDAIKQEERIMTILMVKFTLFFIVGFLLMGFFWYYLSTFCAIYKNSQIPLFKDTLFSYGLSMAYPFGLNLLPGMFRFPALKNEKKTSSCLYSFSKILALI